MNIHQFMNRSSANVIPPENPRAVVGDNQIPLATDIAKQVRDMISDFLAAHPVIDTEQDAKRAMELETQGLRALQEIEDERKKRVKPLNDEVATINDSYKPASVPLAQTRSVLSIRLNAYQLAEKAKREAIAAEAMRQAEEKIRLAQEAAAREREALENAEAGEIGIKVGDVVADTAEATRDAEKAIRQAQIAQKDTAVKINMGFGKSRSLREPEVLSVTDPVKAIEAIGLTEKIMEAILTGARAYRALRKELPPGVTSNKV